MTSSRKAKIRATFDQLDRWHQQLQAVFVPEPGSELADDDTDWPWLPVSQVAFTGMGAARDHLQAVRSHIETGELFLFAHQTPDPHRNPRRRAGGVGAGPGRTQRTPHGPARSPRRATASTSRSSTTCGRSHRTPIPAPRRSCSTPNGGWQS